MGGGIRYVVTDESMLVLCSQDIACTQKAGSGEGSQPLVFDPATSASRTDATATPVIILIYSSTMRR